MFIPDRNVVDPIFQDEEIDAFILLAQVGGTLDQATLLRAAADAIEVIATDQTLTLKAIKLMEMTTNGDKVGAELRARANSLRSRADEIDAQSTGGFDVIEQVFDQFSYKERVWDEFLRER